MKHTIIIVGVLDKKGSTNISQAKAFIKLGWNVIPLNYRTIIIEYGMKFFENILIDTVKEHRPSIVLFSKTNGIDPELIKRCGEYTNTFYWFMDSIQIAEGIPGILDNAKNSNFVSCTGGGVSDWFVENGVQKCYHIFDGVDTDIFKPVESFDKYKADISLIGSRTTERDKFKQALERDFDVKFYGNGYGGEVINEEFAKVCASSKIMLSMNVFNTAPRYFSNRLFRYLGCGSCVAHWDSTGTMDEFFENDKELILFNTIEELKNKVKYLLQNEDKAGEMAIRGRELVLNNYTWMHTVSKIIEVVNKG